MSGKVTTGKLKPTVSQHGIKHGSDEKHLPASHNPAGKYSGKSTHSSSKGW